MSESKQSGFSNRLAPGYYRGFAEEDPRRDQPIRKVVGVFANHCTPFIPGWSPTVPYRPKPIKTAEVTLNEDLVGLTELLAKHNHDIWSLQRIKDGWKLGAKRNDAKKEHPCLIPYEDLPESEKEYDRNAAMQTLKAIIALGYRITKQRQRGGSP